MLALNTFNIIYCFFCWYKSCMSPTKNIFLFPKVVDCCLYFAMKIEACKLLLYESF